MNKDALPNRRRVLAGLGAGTLAAASAARAAAPSPLLKAIPSSGEKVPAIGMGSWLTFDVGGDKAAIAQRTEVLRTFFSLGGRVIDSSPMYGTSQEVIGEGLARLGRPAALFAADKVWTPRGENGAAQIAESRRRWGVPKFDLLEVHNLVDWRRHLATLFEMKAAGDVRYVGVTTYAGLRHDEVEAIMQSEPLDFVQLTYNILDREAEARLLPLAAEKGVAVIANRPFREGALFEIFRGRKLPAIAAETGASNWAQFMLKFIVSHPAITAAIPATRRVDHMRENMGALSGGIPDAALRREMLRAIDEV
jgi:diketogulonate reductase-like aldo/keto reductase